MKVIIYQIDEHCISASEIIEGNPHLATYNDYERLEKIRDKYPSVCEHTIHLVTPYTARMDKMVEDEILTFDSITNEMKRDTKRWAYKVCEHGISSWPFDEPITEDGILSLPISLARAILYAVPETLYSSVNVPDFSID